MRSPGVYDLGGLERLREDWRGLPLDRRVWWQHSTPALSHLHGTSSAGPSLLGRGGGVGPGHLWKSSLLLSSRRNIDPT